MSIDRLDFRIVAFFSTHPRSSVAAAAKELGVARQTVQARLERLSAAGVVQGRESRLDPASLGYPVSAICRAQIDQRVGHEVVLARLREIPEVLDLYTVAGDFDLALRLVARSNEDLQRVLDHITTIPAVQRTSSEIVLRSHFHGRTLPLLDAATRDDESIGAQASRDRGGHNGGDGRHART
ncbi:Lrp/AsnC family transcriptional regulator [Pseudoclavibacter chungangensis]|uniref:Lrp/AsnC family transcriptional regulator n=1 Tax=Pseudoclavibacter chungangensis TaxID=587635 RepID=A0A7J5BPK8_9MICO|nr:Lrp/AsnC family transcriptional regulator [Pseudoclavibacter chungangensis]KAB1655098.1 Lrp/AsnC family transcriptional regulator [Pseudoclavibacter chungangensis]NYJ66132.1 Lrp/AsnC family transcriptional regulator for asnA, asnC and gidA [Pseudoclavibacter chungangensis]